MDHLNPGGGGCGKPRSRHCTPAWVTKAKLRLKKKKKDGERSFKYPSEPNLIICTFKSREQSSAEKKACQRKKLERFHLRSFGGDIAGFEI